MGKSLSLKGKLLFTSLRFKIQKEVPRFLNLFCGFGDVHKDFLNVNDWQNYNKLVSLLTVLNPMPALRSAVTYC